MSTNRIDNLAPTPIYRDIALGIGFDEQSEYHRQMITKVIEEYGPSNANYNPELFKALNTVLNNHVREGRFQVPLDDYRASLENALEDALRGFQHNPQP